MNLSHGHRLFVVLALGCGGTPVIPTDSPQAASRVEPVGDQASEEAVTDLHVATQAQMDRLLDTWRQEIVVAAVARAESGDVDAEVEEDRPYAFRGTLEEEDLITVEWLWGTVALAVFDRAPEYGALESFGPTEHSPSSARTGYLVGPDALVDVTEHLFYEGDDDCRHFSDYRAQLELGSEENIGFLQSTAPDTNGEAILHFWVDEGRLWTESGSCAESYPGQTPIHEGPCGHSVGCHITAYADADAPACLDMLKGLEADLALARLQAVLAPRAYADANPVELAGSDFRARAVAGEARACTAPPRAQRLAARRALLRYVDDSSVGDWEETRRNGYSELPDEAERTDEDRAEIAQMADATKAEMRRSWQHVHFSCSSTEGFALQLGDAVYFYDGTDASPLHTHVGRGDLNAADREYDIGDISGSSLRRFDADGDGWLDWLSSETWTPYEDRDAICEGKPQCTATLVTRDGVQELACDAMFIATPHGVIVWEPTGEEPVWTLQTGAAIESELARFSESVARAGELEERNTALELLRSLQADNAAAVVEALLALGIPNADARVHRLVASMPGQTPRSRPR